MSKILDLVRELRTCERESVMIQEDGMGRYRSIAEGFRLASEELILKSLQIEEKIVRELYELSKDEQERDRPAEEKD